MNEGGYDETQMKGDGGSGWGGGSRDGEYGVFTPHCISRAFLTTLLNVLTSLTHPGIPQPPCCLFPYGMLYILSVNCYLLPPMRMSTYVRAGFARSVYRCFSST